MASLCFRIHLHTKAPIGGAHNQIPLHHLDILPYEMGRVAHLHELERLQRPRYVPKNVGGMMYNPCLGGNLLNKPISNHLCKLYRVGPQVLIRS